ncbi:MAG: hypothetical protein KatS3mg087_1651 [Patescibacteria group bacterium]|nr:MAG: hypothetical protein KatS3mg087_1651 [Patescibacteria group bacterium]
MGGDPATLLAIGTAMSAASTVMSTISSVREQRFNAALQEAQARMFEQRAKIEKQQVDREKRRLLGRQRALFLKSGVLLEGTPLELLAETEAEFELEKQTREFNLATQASLARSRAKEIKRGIVPTIIGGALSVGGDLVNFSIAKSKLKPAAKPSTISTFQSIQRSTLPQRTSRAIAMGASPIL